MVEVIIDPFHAGHLKDLQCFSRLSSLFYINGHDYIILSDYQVDRFNLWKHQDPSRLEFTWYCLTLSRICICLTVPS